MGGDNAGAAAASLASSALGDGVDVDVVGGGCTGEHDGVFSDGEVADQGLAGAAVGVGIAEPIGGAQIKDIQGAGGAMEDVHTELTEGGFVAGSDDATPDQPVAAGAAGQHIHAELTIEDQLAVEGGPAGTITGTADGVEPRAGCDGEAVDAVEGFQGFPSGHIHGGGALAPPPSDGDRLGNEAELVDAGGVAGTGLAGDEQREGVDLSRHHVAFLWWRNDLLLDAGGERCERFAVALTVGVADQQLQLLARISAGGDVGVSGAGGGPGISGVAAGLPGVGEGCAGQKIAVAVARELRSAERAADRCGCLNSNDSGT